MKETFTVECTDNDTTGKARTIVHTGLSYFDALDALREAGALFIRSRFILCVSTDTRTRMLADTDSDNVTRLARGLHPVRYVETTPAREVQAESAMSAPFGGQ